MAWGSATASVEATIASHYNELEAINLAGDNIYERIEKMYIALKTQNDGIKDTLDLITKWQENEDKIDNAILQLKEGNAVLLKDFFNEGVDDLKASVQAYSDL